MEKITIYSNCRLRNTCIRDWKIQEQDGIGGKRDINERTGQ
jgi:hypothetical protein